MNPANKAETKIAAAKAHVFRDAKALRKALKEVSKKAGKKLALLGDGSVFWGEPAF
jgi:hypothetical protein